MSKPQLSSTDQLANLGEEIRQLRKVRGITLQEMADTIGKSVGFLSQVERNITKPSVAALQDISEVLDIHIGWFFSADPADPSEPEDERRYVVRKVNRRRLSYSAISGTDYLGLNDHLLSTNLNGELALGISRYEPGASTGDDSYQHTGEEAGIVLSGTLELLIEGKPYLLEAGDSFSFPSQLDHRFSNPSDTVDTVVVWANTPISLRK